MSGVSWQKTSYSTEEWENKLNAVEVDKDDLNALVMNYLVIEGFKDAAVAFQEESGAPLQGVDAKSITERMAIRSAIQAGDVETAIDRVNDLNPEILDTNAQLYFHLQQQKLIELIRNGDVDEALAFAQDELAPRGEENPRFLNDMEQTMALLAFDPSAESPVASLLSPAQRQKTASELNAAILTAQCQEKDPKLPSLLKMLLWAQNKLAEKVEFPKMANLATAELADPSPSSSGSS